MIVLLEIQGQTVAIFKRDRCFFVSIGGRELETSFATYYKAYAFVRRLFPSKFGNEEKSDV